MFESRHFCSVLIRFLVREGDAVIKEIKLLSVLMQYDGCAKGKN